MSSALVPVTPETLMRLVLDLNLEPEPEPEAERPSSARRSSGTSSSWRPGMTPNPWKVAAWTSLAWLAVLGLTVVGFMAVLERQDRQLELLLERNAPASQAP